MNADIGKVNSFNLTHGEKEPHNWECSVAYT